MLLTSTRHALSPPGRRKQSRAAASSRTGLPPDPFDLALSVADGQDPAMLRGVIERRLGDYTRALSGLQTELESLRPRLEPTALAVFEHVIPGAPRGSPRSSGPRRPGCETAMDDVDALVVPSDLALAPGARPPRRLRGVAVRSNG